jgi:hypothetical protein
MTTDEARALLLSSINRENFYYSHELPFAYSDWIDGLAWGSLARGAALLKSDFEVADLLFEYTNRIVSIGKDARNFAPIQVKPDWVQSQSIPGLWYNVKPQAFAGPSALNWANQCAKKMSKPSVTDPFDVKSQAKWMVTGGWLWGMFAKHSEFLRGYIDSMWLAHLMLDKKPASTMLWMCEENQFFSYIAKKKCSVEYPEPHRYTEGVTEMQKTVVPLKDCEPSAWIFRRDPFNKYTRNGVPQPKMYTPIWQVVGDYLQSTL